ncbi:DODA-type extradiol aromatic ring-opening family dioxygenase [Rhodococcus koreensis]
MSKIVAVAGTSHSPMLGMEPERMWRLRAKNDADNDYDLFDQKGDIRSFDELVTAADGRYDEELSLDVWNEKYSNALACVDRLREELIELKPDLIVVIGDDQEELFTPRNQPAIAVYYGEKIETHRPIDMGNALLSEVQHNLGMDGEIYPAHPQAALHIIKELIAHDFDVATSSETETEGGFGHAFAWVVGRMLKNITIPMVPVLINTYYPPNQPSPARCYDLGRALAEAVDSLPGDLRVAVVASGGLSHFVVNDELDRQILEAMRTHDEATLRTLPVEQLDSGTSEVRNWIAAAGAGRNLAHKWSTYVPAWRSAAGTGVGLAFGLWS